ncbi:TonB-dependent receptor [Novosphingobium malaysiense]|uniref:TonB-dependent receptor n=1 Tax=Novosphingobium malaysiense TaxID=1348853 RepID=A0A0B1ZNF2_9SPHN|nr:TonB-dependent receptor [Novosphingobium malaysiense]KHK92655.1 TonB-dependent receptor [Novosphingobium malaysiense]
MKLSKKRSSKLGTMGRIGISVVAVQWACAAAHAQDAAPQAAEESGGGIAEIIVTAQKRAENLQDVPISVAAVSAQAVEDMHATTLQALQGAVPNVQIGNFSNAPASAVFTIRGIGVIEPDPYAGNTVGIVVDGVPQFFSMGALVDLYDVDRIEVLRGPQGTLFGANTTGGVVNVVNSQPTDKFEGRVDLSYGNYNHFQAAGVLNVPLSESLSGRFVVSHDRRDGWVTNVYDGSDMGRRNVTVMRGILKYDPGTNVDITLSGEYDRGRNGAPVVVAGDLPGEAQYVDTGLAGMYASPCLPMGSRCKAPDHYFSALDPGPKDANGNFVDPIKDRSDMDTYRTSLTVNIGDTAVGDITSITAYKHFHLFEYTDQDGTPLFLDDTRRRTKGWQFSQELRTSIDLNDSINLLVGGFYLKDHYEHYQKFRINFAGGFSYDPATGNVTYGLPGLYQLNLQDQDNYSLSGFAQSYVDLTDQLRLQAGIRYTYEKTSMLASTTTTLATGGVTTFDGTAPDGTPNVLIDAAAPPRGSKSWQNLGWKVGLDYRPVDDLLLYGYWARGFKSGGFTGRIGIEQDLGPYGPEKVDTFEAGIKTEFLDRKIRFNFAGFYTNYRDLQLAQIYFLGSGASLRQGNTILNVASAQIKGFEAELLAAPVHGLTLNGSLAYLSAKYKDFPFQLPDDDGDPATPPPVLELAGQRLQNAPKWTATVGFMWEFPVGDMNGRIGAQYNYTSEKLYSSIIDTARASVQPTHIVNANADLAINESLTLSVWGTNIFDQRYTNSVFDVPGTIGLVNYAPPRQYGVSAKYTF